LSGDGQQTAGAGGLSGNALHCGSYVK